jgi:hypothetical protein
VGQTPAQQGSATLRHLKVVFDIASPSIIMPECLSLMNSGPAATVINAKAC